MVSTAVLIVCADSILRKVLPCGCVMTWQRNEESWFDYALVSVECDEKHYDEMQAIPSWCPQMVS